MGKDVEIDLPSEHPITAEGARSGINSPEVKSILLGVAPEYAQKFLDSTELQAVFSLTPPRTFRANWETDVVKQMDAAEKEETKRLGHKLTDAERFTIRSGVVLSAVNESNIAAETERHTRADGLLAYIRGEKGTDYDKEKLAELTAFAGKKVEKEMRQKGKWDDKSAGSPEFKAAVDQKVHDLMMPITLGRHRSAMYSAGLMEDPPQLTGNIVWQAPGSAIDTNLIFMRGQEKVFDFIGGKVGAAKDKAGDAVGAFGGLLNLFNKKPAEKKPDEKAKPEEKPEGGGKQSRADTLPPRFAAAEVDNPAGKPYTGGMPPKNKDRIV